MSQFNRSQWVLLFLLTSIQFTHHVDFMIIMPLGPQLMRLFSLSPNEFSLLVSSYTFTAGIISPLCATFIDRFNRKSILQTFFILFSLCTLCCAFATTYTTLLLARALTGAFGGVLNALSLSIVGDTFPLERRASAVGVVMASFSIASVIGVPLSLYLATLWSWHAPFILLGGLGLFISFGIALGLKPMTGHLNPDQPRTGFFHVFSQVAQSAQQRRALVFMAVLMFGHFIIIPFIGPSMVFNVGMSEGQLAYIYLLGGGLTFFTSPLIGRLVDRYGRLQLYTLLTFSCVLPIIVITGLHGRSIPLAYVCTSLFFIISSGRMIASTTMITAVVPPQQRGGFMGLNSSVQQLSLGISTLVAGPIIQRGVGGEFLHYDKVGYISIVVALLSIFFARTLKAVE